MIVPFVDVRFSMNSLIGAPISAYISLAVFFLGHLFALPL